MASKQSLLRHLRRQFALGLFATLSVAMVAGCGGKGGGIVQKTPPTLTSATETCTPTSIAVGSTATCSGTEHWSDNTTDANVAYSSDNPAIATVDTTGKVTGVAAGTADIIATAKGGSVKPASVKITVTAQAPTVTSVTESCASTSITVGASTTCSGVRHFSDNTTDANVAYSSDNPAIATVDTTGKVTGVAAGTADIIATDSKGTLSASVNITVTAQAPTVTSVAVGPQNSTITTGGTQQFTPTVSCNTSTCPQTVSWASSPASAGMISASGLFTASSTITASTQVTITACSTVSGYTTICGSVQATVNPAAAQVTAVTLQCASTSFSNIQTTTCTPTVSGTGSFANTVNLSVVPASAGTLSAASNVSSGTAVTFTPTFANGAEQATIVATSTADATKSDSVAVTVTLRTIAVNSSTGIIWLPICSGLFSFNVTQSGIVGGDTFHIDPYQPDTFNSAPKNPFPISLGIGNHPNQIEPCSPGAYHMYVTGTDGAKSNTHHVPIFGPWNMWGGYNSTDEYVVDFAVGQTCRFSLATGNPDGTCLPFSALSTTVDGPNLVVSDLEGIGVEVESAATGQFVNSIKRSGDSIADVSAKNNIVGYTNTNNGTPQVSFFDETLNNNIADVPTGTSPKAIAMSKACNAAPATATAFVFDEERNAVYRADATEQSVAPGQPVPITASKVDSVQLSGLTPASQLASQSSTTHLGNTAPRFLVAWDSTCKAAVLAPLVTGTNPDGSTAYNMNLVLIDGTSGNGVTMKVLGSVNSTTVNGVATGIPSTANNMVADVAGNSVIIASADESTGNTTLTRVSWTLDASEVPTFTVTRLASVPPTGVYAAALGFLPNGKISVSQRANPAANEHYLLNNQ